MMERRLGGFRGMVRLTRRAGSLYFLPRPVKPVSLQGELISPITPAAPRRNPTRERREHRLWRMRRRKLAENDSEMDVSSRAGLRTRRDRRPRWVGRLLKAGDFSDTPADRLTR